MSMISAVICIVIANALISALGILLLPAMQRRYAYWRLYIRMRDSAINIKPISGWLSDKMMVAAKRLRKKAIGI